MSGSYFIAQASKFILIYETAVTLGQGHGKAIQYISPDPYILCAKYRRFSSNGFDVRGKIAAADAVDAAETNWKHKVTPDRGDLINWWSCTWNTIWVYGCCAAEHEIHVTAQRFCD